MKSQMNFIRTRKLVFIFAFRFTWCCCSLRALERIFVCAFSISCSHIDVCCGWDHERFLIVSHDDFVFFCCFQIYFTFTRLNLTAHLIRSPTRHFVRWWIDEFTHTHTHNVIISFDPTDVIVSSLLAQWFVHCGTVCICPLTPPVCCPLPFCLCGKHSRRCSVLPLLRSSWVLSFDQILNYELFM